MLSLLTLLDDIATTLDDVAIMTKVAIKKTSALMSDDLAVNAGVIKGLRPDQELPIVKAIFLGSLVNKVIAIAGVFALMLLYPPLIKVVLFIGGLYLSFEGAHKISEKLKGALNKQGPVRRDRDITKEQRIKGAVKTDLVLSIEIIVLAQSAIKGTLTQQLLTLIIVGLAASILIYGLVAILVKVDDLGLYLIDRDFIKTGQVLVYTMPYFMKGLGIIGTVAMLLVGGGIMVHLFHVPLLKWPAGEILTNLVLGLLVGGCAVFLNWCCSILKTKILKIQ